MMKRCVAILLLSIGWIACEKTVEIEIPYAGDKIVVNTLLQPDSLVYLRVTRSQPPGASVFPELKDAVVSLKAGTTAVPLQWQVIGGKGYFVSQTPVQEGLRYSVTISATGLDTITATDTLPRRPALREPFAQAGGSRVRFQMKDLPGQDYYRFRLYVSDEDGRMVSRARFRFDASYNNSFTDLVSDNFIESALIPDERFEGRDITVVMQTERVNVPGGFLLLEVTNLTQSGWQYLKSEELQTANSGNPLLDPILVYTNVVKGYGIMAGVNSAYLKVEIK